MARPRKPWYRSERNAWFVEVDGKQVPLGEHPDAFPRPVKTKGGWNPPPPIVAAYGRLMEKKGDQKEEPAPKDSIVSLLGSYLAWVQRHKSDATYQQRRHFLKSFVRHRRVKTLRPDKVTVVRLVYDSPLTDMERPREQRWTHDAQQKLFSGDKGFEYVKAAANWHGQWGGEKKKLKKGERRNSDKQRGSKKKDR